MAYQSLSSAALIIAANSTLKLVSEDLDRLCADEFPPDIVERLDNTITRLLEHVATLAVARHGIVKRNPTFDLKTVENSVGALSRAMNVLTEGDTLELLTR